MHLFCILSKLFRVFSVQEGTKKKKKKGTDIKNCLSFCKASE